MPLAVFDIGADASAQPARPEDPAGPGRYRWLHFDLSDPSLAPWAAAALPGLAADALTQPETRPRCDLLGDGIIANLRGVNLNEGQAVEQMASVRIWAQPGMIVTVRVRRVFALDALRARCMSGTAPESVGDFLAALTEELAIRTRDVMLDLEAETEALEEQFEDIGRIASAAPDLLEPRRKVIRLLRYLVPQRMALTRMLALETPIFHDAARLDLREATNIAVLGVEGLEALKTRLEALHDAAEAETAARLGRNGYALSLVAAIFLPLGALTGLFGVNVAGMPGTQWPGAFAMLCGVVLLSALAAVVILRWLRLL